MSSKPRQKNSSYGESFGIYGVFVRSIVLFNFVWSCHTKTNLLKFSTGLTEARGFCEPRTNIPDFEVESTVLNYFALNVAVIEINLLIQIFSGVSSLNLRCLSHK